MCTLQPSGSPLSPAAVAAAAAAAIFGSSGYALIGPRRTVVGAASKDQRSVLRSDISILTFFSSSFFSSFFAVRVARRAALLGGPSKIKDQFYRSKISLDLTFTVFSFSLFSSSAPFVVTLTAEVTILDGVATVCDYGIDYRTLPTVPLQQVRLCFLPQSFWKGRAVRGSDISQIEYHNRIL